MEQNQFKKSYCFIWGGGIKKCINVFYTLKGQAFVSVYVFREKVKIVWNFNLYVRNHQ